MNVEKYSWLIQAVVSKERQSRQELSMLGRKGLGGGCHQWKRHMRCKVNIESKDTSTSRAEESPDQVLNVPLFDCQMGGVDDLGKRALVWREVEASMYSLVVPDGKKLKNIPSSCMAIHRGLSIMKINDRGIGISMKLKWLDDKMKIAIHVKHYCLDRSESVLVIQEQTEQLVSLMSLVWSSDRKWRKWRDAKATRKSAPPSRIHPPWLQLGAETEGDDSVRSEM